ncbi:hypothetical protein ACHQM5_026867 [Ranunculus cassubicifolius]
MTGKGSKRKIDIKKIEHREALMVTFSKRHSSVFNKASELTSLCGAETAIVLFSPTDKPYSFGHPSVNKVCDRFLNNNIVPPQDETDILLEIDRDSTVEDLTHECNELYDELEVETLQASENKLKIVEFNETQRLLHAKIDNLGVEQLEELMAMLKEVHMKASEESNRRGSQ